MLKTTSHITSDKRNYKSLNKDLSSVLNKHSGLMVYYKQQIPLYVYGIYRIIDPNGNEQGSWNIKIPIPKKYPFEFPQLIETSKKIERCADRHIDPFGYACVELDIISDVVASKGITIYDFIENYVLKYFSWQLLYDIGDNEILRAWDHAQKGKKQFFRELLLTNDDAFILKSLELLKTKKIPERNNPCFCNSGKKYKRCHESLLKQMEKYVYKDINKYILLFQRE